MKRPKLKLLLASAIVPLTLAGVPAIAGEFDGVELRVKLIGGDQYEPLYAEIEKWEAETGATVNILSRKNHFELDREIKQDIAAGTLNWCVGSNHTSFAPQYGAIYRDLNDVIDASVLAEFDALAIKNSTVHGRLVQLPRHSDISNMYYLKSVFEDQANKDGFKAKYGYDLAPPETWDQVKDQAIYLTKSPDFFGTQYVGKDEAITGRFYELLVANGGALFDADWNPTFNSAAGVEAVSWFKDLYDAGAVPKGVLSYLWGETGNGFASGTIALNLDWGGWASYFNSADATAGNVGLIRAPKGSAGIRTGWSGSHTFSITETCDNVKAAASFVTFLTDYDRQMVEASKGLLPTRTQVWVDATAQFKADGNVFLANVMEVYSQSMAEDAFTPPLIPEWIEVSNEIWPRLQSAILGEMTIQAALDEAAKSAAEVMKDAGY